jgi:sulfite reductase (NADPH) hemoprotein beta-component
VADAISRRFDDLDYLYDIGEIDVNISGCINACGHHHVGHIGILGVDKAGEEWYQITVGGRQGNDARIGRIIGRAVARNEVADVVSRLVDVYLERRDEAHERFIDVVDRLGLEPFKERVYAHLD